MVWARRPAVSPARLRAAIWVLALGLAVLAVRAADLSVRQHERWDLLARSNLTADRAVPALRGRIFDQHGIVLADNRRSYTISATAHRVGHEAVQASLEQAAGLLQRPVSSLYDSLLPTHALTNASREVFRNERQGNILALMERIRELPGLTLHEQFRREYPLGPATALLLGSTSPDDRSPTILVGRSGLESRLEPILRGEPGLERRHRDARGRALGTPERLREAIPGADVTLTLDARWQAEAYQLMADKTGSIVVLDAHTGAIRVLVGAPAYDPDRPAAALPDGRPSSQFHRPARAAMPPGSVIKPFVAIAGTRAGVSPGDRISCSGSVRLAGWLRPFHCNVRSGHGALDLAESLQVSCNVYYFELVRRIGIDRTLNELRRFGFGTATGAGLPGEARGQVAGEASPREGEALNLSIGQGRMQATPLQVARAYAALANGTHLPGLHIAAEARHPDGRVERLPTGPRAEVSIPAAARAAVLDGLYRAVNSPGGTARRAGFAEGWQVCGKTGTVENAQGTSDAWFAGFWPRQAPRFVIVVQVEDTGGRGGDVAAPIARDLMAIIEGSPAPPPMPGLARLP